MKGYLLIAVVVGAGAGIGPAAAQDGGKVMIDVADCIKLEAAEARLACYESRVAAVFSDRATQAAARPAAPTQAPVAAVRAPEPAPVAPPPAAPPAAAPPAATAPPAVAPPASRSVPAAPVASAPAATEPAQSRGDRQSRRGEKEQAAADAASNDIVSRIKELREILPDSWQLTLENGQVWRQTFSKHYELRPGYHVRIYGTKWGSASRLSAEEVKGYIQVERVR